MNLNERQLTRAIYSIWDFQQALSALTFLLEECDFDETYNKIQLRRFRCYETTLIISMTRPFEASRDGTTLNRRVTDVQLDSQEERLIKKLLHLRRKVIAHSDEEEMHFRSGTYLVLDGKLNFPHIQFDESLHLDKTAFVQLESLLHKLIGTLTKFIFLLSQDNPDCFQKYKVPHRFRADNDGT